MALDVLTYKNAKNFYRCAKEEPGMRGKPEVVKGACGSFGQPCCNTGKFATQCGSGLACNLGMFTNFNSDE
jgi:hypothetical protein